MITHSCNISLIAIVFSVFIFRVLTIMIHSLWCHFQRSFLFDLNSYLDHHVCMRESISLTKGRLSVIIRILWCNILAFILLLSFQLILSRTPCTHDLYLRLLKTLVVFITLLLSFLFFLLSFEVQHCWRFYLAYLVAFD